MGDKGWICGGDNNPTTLREYDVSDNAWTTKTSSTNNHRASTGWGRDKGYVMGDCYYPGYWALDLKTDEYNPTSNSWTAKAKSPLYAGTGGGDNVGSGHSECVGQYGYVTYGLAGARYDCINDVWGGIRPSAVSVGGVSSGVNGTDRVPRWSIDDYIYHIQSDTPAKLGEYSIANDSWTEKSSCSMSPAPTRSGGWGLGQYGYCCGGAGATYNWEWSKAGNSWTSRASYSGDGATGFRFNSTLKGYLGAGDGGFQEYNQASNSWAGKSGYGYSDKGKSSFALLENLPPNAPSGLSVSAT